MNNPLRALLCGALIATVGTAPLACTTALDRRDGSTLRVDLIGGDKKYIYANDNDRIIAVPRASIVDIDHPGNVPMVLSIIPFFFSLETLAVNAAVQSDCFGNNCSSSTNNALRNTGLTLAAIGVGMLVGGYISWSNSRQAAADTTMDALPGTIFEKPMLLGRQTDPDQDAPDRSVVKPPPRKPPVGVAPQQPPPSEPSERDHPPEGRPPHDPVPPDPLPSEDSSNPH